MYLLGYFPALSQPNHPYCLLVEDGGLGKGDEFYDTLEEFSQRLGSPLREGTVVVLVLDTPSQMDDILSLRERLGDLPLAVVLPSHDPALVGRAHLLRPRFLTYQDQEPAVLLLVLANIARKHWPGLAAHATEAGGEPTPSHDARR